MDPSLVNDRLEGPLVSFRVSGGRNGIWRVVCHRGYLSSIRFMAALLMHLKGVDPFKTILMAFQRISIVPLVYSALAVNSVRLGLMRDPSTICRTPF
jgi:hypothetical protein